MKTRIIKRTFPDGKYEYAIQQPHFLFRWWWVDASTNYIYPEHTQDRFATLDEAEKNRCWFDGTKTAETVVG